MGEAAARISEPFREQHPDLPWRQVIGMRNRLIHGYDDIVLSVVWEVIQNDLPKLIQALEPLAP